MRDDCKVVIAASVLFVTLAAAFLLLGRSHAPTGEDGTPPAASGMPLADSGDSLVPAAPHPVHLQPFDPNTAAPEVLRQVGLSDFLIRSILRYRSKGGTYQHNEDFARVPGLTWGQYQQLLPYISIADEYRPARDFIAPRTAATTAPRDTLRYPQKLAAGEHLSLNDADTAALRRVPGIGVYYAQRIVSLRERLGGFVSLEQLREIRGLPDDCYNYLVILDGGITTLNINTCEFRALQRHPYIGRARAQQIMDYRKLKGAITSLDDLALLPGFSSEERRRLEPYISY